MCCYSGGELHELLAGVWLGFAQTLRCDLFKWIMDLLRGKTSRMLVICQFYHTVKAKQMEFDPLSILDRPQPWNCSCFSKVRRQTSKLNLFVVGVSSACLLIRLFKTGWVCIKAGHKQRRIVHICVVCLDFYRSTLNTHQELDPFYSLEVATVVINPILLSRLL